MFQLADNPAFITTVGKLNFFRWAIEKGILDYIKLNLASIEKEMNESARELQKVRKADTKTPATNAKRITRRKMAASENVSTKQMQKHFSPIEVTFD